MSDGLVPMPPGGDEQQQHQDDHDVVQHRGPHRRREAAPRVQHPAGHRADPVEEDLRDEEVGEDHRQVPFRPGQLVRVQVDQQEGGRRGHHGQPEQGGGDQGEHPLGIALAAVGVPPGRADQQRDHHRAQDAAEHQVVDRVGQRVGVVVRVGHADCAERPDGHQGAQEAGAPGGQRADGHHAAGPDQAGAFRRRGPLVSGCRLGRRRGWRLLPGVRVAGVLVAGELWRRVIAVAGLAGCRIGLARPDRGLPRARLPRIAILGAAILGVGVGLGHLRVAIALVSTGLGGPPGGAATSWCAAAPGAAATVRAAPPSLGRWRIHPAPRAFRRPRASC